MTIPKGFPLISDVLYNGNKQKMLKHIKNDFKHSKIPFATKTTKKLYQKYIKAREQELQI